jgi:hypothetical protein
MLARSRQLAASFFTQLAGGDSDVAVWRLPVCGRAHHGFLPVGPRACRSVSRSQSRCAIARCYSCASPKHPLVEKSIRSLDVLTVKSWLDRLIRSRWKSMKTKTDKVLARIGASCDAGGLARTWPVRQTGRKSTATDRFAWSRRFRANWIALDIGRMARVDWFIGMPAVCQKMAIYGQTRQMNSFSISVRRV